MNPFFIIFKGFSIAKNCLRPESEPLYTPNSFSEIYVNSKNTKFVFDIFVLKEVASIDIY